MIYFIPNWRQKDLHLEKETIMSITQLFLEEKQEYQLILLNYLPFLRYKLQEYSSLSSNYWNVYDVVQNIQIQTGHPMGVEDLNLPENVEKIYHPQGITLVVDGDSKGYISFNQYGFLDKVIYVDEYQNKIDYYDDRGFLSSSDYFTTNGTAIKRYYFNEKGQHTLSEYFGDTPKVVIEKDGNDHFKNKEYRTIDDLIIDTMNEYAQQFSKGDCLIAPLGLNRYELLQTMYQKIQMWLIVSEKEKLKEMSQTILMKLYQIANGFITGSTVKKKELKEVFKRNQNQVIEEKKIRLIPIYPTQLALGSSNSSEQMIVYFKMKHLDKKNSKMYDYLLDELLKDPTYSLFVEIKDHQMEAKLLQRKKHRINKYYGIDSDSTEYKKVAHYIQMKKEMNLFDTDVKAVEKLKKTKRWNALMSAVNIHNRVEIRVTPSVDAVKKELSQVRIFIDLSSEPDLHIQSLVTSAGIPLIIREKSSYIVDGKNGKVVSRHSEAIWALDYFFKNLRHWNQALVESIEIIEKNSAKNVMKKWRGLLNE